MIVGYENINMELVSAEAQKNLSVLHRLNRRFYLIGSHYYGNATVDSDVDLMTENFYSGKTHMFFRMMGYEQKDIYNNDPDIQCVYGCNGIDIQFVTSCSTLRQKMTCHRLLKNVLADKEGCSWFTGKEKNKELQAAVWKVLRSLYEVMTEDVSGIMDFVFDLVNNAASENRACEKRLGNILHFASEIESTECEDNDIPEFEIKYCEECGCTMKLVPVFNEENIIEYEITECSNIYSCPSYDIASEV